MDSLSSSELLLYIGEAVMGLATVSAAACIIIFRITGKKIKRILEQEYGKCLK